MGKQQLFNRAVYVLIVSIPKAFIIRQGRHDTLPGWTKLHPIKENELRWQITRHTLEGTGY